MRGTPATIESVSRAPGQCLLALLGGKVSSHTARRLALCSENWSASRGRPSSANVAGRARTPTLMPGRSLTRPCPGTGTPSLVIERRGRRAFRYSARGPPFSTLERRGSSQPVSTLERFHARCRRHNLAANAARLPPAFRASPTAGTVFRRAVRPASRRRGQSVLAGQPRPASVCSPSLTLGVPAAPRNIAGLGWPTVPDSFAGRCLTPLRDPLRRLRGRFIPFRHIPSRRQARNRGASTALTPASLRSQRQSSGACPEPHTPRNAARTMRRQTALQSLR